MNTLTPDQIKQALADQGISQAGLARDLNVSRSHIHSVIHNRLASHRVRCHIARAINRPVNDLWEIKENPTRNGRPLTKGYFDLHPEAAR
jgi:transcriptional regulator with XRE-family HTH domain